MIRHEQKHEAFPLIDRTEPNLLEDIFSYELPPRIRFQGPIVEYIDGRPVEFNPRFFARDIVITDTTFRDGQQARPPYTVEQMVHIFDLLAKLGGPNGVIRQTEFFLYTSNDRRTLDCCRDLGTPTRNAPVGSAPTRAISGSSARQA